MAGHARSTANLLVLGGNGAHVPVLAAVEGASARAQFYGQQHTVANIVWDALAQSAALARHVPLTAW